MQNTLQTKHKANVRKMEEATYERMLAANFGGKWAERSGIPIGMRKRLDAQARNKTMFQYIRKLAQSNKFYGELQERTIANSPLKDRKPQWGDRRKKSATLA